MSEEQQGTTDAPGETGDGATDEGGPRRFGDGFRQGMGVLAAFKDALEETIQEARERGDLSSDRAREVVKEALQKAQTAAEGARERLDFATQSELEALQQAVDALSARVAELEARLGGAAPEPVREEEDAGTG